jgi:hypothetical protein
MILKENNNLSTFLSFLSILLNILAVLVHQQLNFMIHQPLPHGRQLGVAKHVVDFTKILYQTQIQRFDLIAKCEIQTVYDQGMNCGDYGGDCGGQKTQMEQTSRRSVEEKAAKKGGKLFSGATKALRNNYCIANGSL